MHSGLQSQVASNFYSNLPQTYPAAYTILVDTTSNCSVLLTNPSQAYPTLPTHIVPTIATMEDDQKILIFSFVLMAVVLLILGFLYYRFRVSRKNTILLLNPVLFAYLDIIHIKRKEEEEGNGYSRRVVTL